MGRPGFNCTHWPEFSYEEAMIMGWLGTYSSGTATREDFMKHMEVYIPKVTPYYGVTDEENQRIIAQYKTAQGIEEGLKKVADRISYLKEFGVDDKNVYFQFCDDRLQTEISELKNKGIKKVITLTEDHHNGEVLSEHFDAHHFSIEDLTGPTVKQAVAMSEILKKAKQDKEAVAVHCLAGIGRTSTMIIASHMILGEPLDKLLKQIQYKKPVYKLIKSQKKVIDDVLDYLEEK